jgi:riboflavin synthase
MRKDKTIMFTGIIEHVGTVKTIERADEHVNLTVQSPAWLLKDMNVGSSLCINGACLTAVRVTKDTATFNVVYETMRKTSLGHLAEGDTVNLERAMPADGRFNGHIVQGHVDATGSIASIRQLDNSYLIYIDVPRDLMRYIVSKGSISVDGISLTVVDADDKTFSVAIIPHTWENTNLGYKRAGDPVNIETDIIAKYIGRMSSLGAYSSMPLVMSTEGGFEGQEGSGGSYRTDLLDSQFEMTESRSKTTTLEGMETQTTG